MTSKAACASPHASHSSTTFPKRAPGASLRRPEGGHGVPGPSGARSGEADGEATPEHDACPEAALQVDATGGRWIFRGTSRGFLLVQRSEAGEAEPQNGQSEARMGLPLFITAEGCWQVDPAPPQPSDRAERPLAGVACPRMTINHTLRFHDGEARGASFRRAGGGRLPGRSYELPTASGGAACAWCASFPSPEATCSHRKSRARDSAFPAGRRVRGFFRAKPLCVRLGGELGFYCLRALRSTTTAMAITRRPRRT